MPRAAFPSGRKSLLLLLALATIIGGVWWSQPRPPPEPVYHGKRLSDWLASEVDTHRGDRDRSLTAEAVQAFGAGTIPWLTYTAEHGRHSFKRYGPKPFDKAPDWLRRWLPKTWGGLRQSWSRDDRKDALYALAACGPEAAPAIPALIRVLSRANEADYFMLVDPAARALNTIGVASWPVVEQTLQHGDWQVRWALLSTIDGRVGTPRKPAPEAEVAKVVTILDKACTDPDPKVRALAAEGIWTCYDARKDLLTLDSFVAELIRLLANPDVHVRGEVLHVLRDTNEKVPHAIPRLIELLDDQNSFIRMSTARALANLDNAEKLSAPPLRAMFRDDPVARCREGARDALKDLGLSPDKNNGTSPAPLPGR